ncbi:MAG: diheme cytochrome precursor, partial [Pseudomonadota bacterium]
EQGLSPNTEIYQASRATLIGLLPRPTDSVPPRSAESRALTLARRAKGRAYDGAPPVIPHPIATRAEPNCLVCHEHGAQIAELRAPKMSHPLLQNCPQCHAEGFVREPSAPGPALAESDFGALPLGARGARAWTGAPPVVPHRGFMRQRCDSCHGVAGALGLRTPHADRQSCVQCHVFDEDLDQGSFFSALRLRADVP